MKKVFILILLYSVFIVACNSEYDKMSEYEKVVHDVGISSKMSADDALKNTQLWVESKVISSSLPEGKGDVSVVDYDGEIIRDGGVRFSFVFGEKFRHYATSSVGVEYIGFYAEYDYSIDTVNSVNLKSGPNLNDYNVFGISFDKVRVVAYNESCIVIEVCDGKDKYRPYKTFVLKPGTQARKDKLEKYCTDVETFEKVLENI